MIVALVVNDGDVASVKKIGHETGDEVVAILAASFVTLRVFWILIRATTFNQSVGLTLDHAA